MRLRILLFAGLDVLLYSTMAKKAHALNPKKKRTRVKRSTKTKSKPEPKARAARSRPSPSGSRILTDSLQRRLQTEFAESIRRAELYIADRDRLNDLIGEATDKVKSMPRQQLRDIAVPLQTMLRLVRAYARRDYRSIAPAALLHMVGALLYLVNPLDLLPDSIPGIGLLDDIFVLGLTVRRTRGDLAKFVVWEKQ